MRDNEILDHIKGGIEEAPINILDNIKGQQVVKMIEHDEITRQEKKRSFRPIMSFVSVAAVFLLVFINISLVRMPDSQIYLDVNPSLQITTNRRDNVIDLIAINEDALGIVEGIDYKGKDLNTVTEEIMDYFVEESFIDDDHGAVLVSVYNEDSEKSKHQADELNDVITNKLNDSDRHPILLTQSIDKSNAVDDFAERYGISVGKMTFIRNLIILNPDLKTEDLVELSLRELIELFQNKGIDIEKIIDDEDDEDEDDVEIDSQIENTTPTPTPAKRQLIGEARAREIALGLVNGKIVDFELDDDDDDPEYKIEIVANGYEYEIEIDGYTGKVLEFEKDDYDDDDDDDDDD